MLRFDDRTSHHIPWHNLAGAVLRFNDITSLGTIWHLAYCPGKKLETQDLIVDGQTQSNILRFRGVINILHRSPTNAIERSVGISR
jgi:hypothetical protein